MPLFPLILIQPDPHRDTRLNAVGSDFILQPHASVSFPGADVISSVGFSPDGKLLYAQLPGIKTINLWAAATYYWPEVLGAILALIALITILALRRVINHRGLPHCRRCNYCLVDCPSPVCPECGLDSSRRRPIRGRPLWLRTAPSLTVLVVVSSAYATLWIAHIPRKNAAAEWLSLCSVSLHQLLVRHRWSHPGHGHDGPSLRD